MKLSAHHRQCFAGRFSSGQTLYKFLSDKDESWFVRSGFGAGTCDAESITPRLRDVS
jgi:hypothetical protein